MFKRLARTFTDLKNETKKQAPWLFQPVTAAVFIAIAIVGTVAAGVFSEIGSQIVGEDDPPPPIAHAHIVFDTFRLDPRSTYYTEPIAADTQRLATIQGHFFDNRLFEVLDEDLCITPTARTDAYVLLTTLRLQTDKARALPILYEARDALRENRRPQGQNARSAGSVIAALRHAGFISDRVQPEDQYGLEVVHDAIAMGENISARSFRIDPDETNENPYDMPSAAAAALDVVVRNEGNAPVTISEVWLETTAINTYDFGSGDGEVGIAYPLRVQAEINLVVGQDGHAQFETPYVFRPGDTGHFKANVEPDVAWVTNPEDNLQVTAWIGRIHVGNTSGSVAESDLVCVVLPVSSEDAIGGLQIR